MKPVISLLPFNAAMKFGNAVALETDEISLTFIEVEERVSRFAAGLSKQGVTKGDRVILHLPNDWQWVIAYYAIARLGGVVIPANFLLSLEEIVYIASDCEAICFIGPKDRCLKISDALGADKKLELLIFTEACDQTDDAPELINFEKVLIEERLDPIELDPKDLWTIAYTSGTTGTPKGAMLTHEAVYQSTALTSTMHVRHVGERVISALPFPHVYGNVVLNSCFLVGMTLITTRRFDAGWALSKIQERKATLFEGVPTMYHYLLTHPSVNDADLKSLRRCTVGGQSMPISKINEITRIFGCPLLELWGMTEVAGPATTHSPYLPSKYGSVGPALPGLELRVASSEKPTEPLGVGEEGELQVRGVTVMVGYYNKPEATADNILPGGWLRTGDVAYIDAAGYVHVVDRLKDMIITAGYKIYPAELEQAIAKHPAVAMAAVASVADEVKGELAKAFVVLRPNMHVSEEELLSFCKQELAAYKVPKSIEFTDVLPTNSTGKILRRALRA